jgi:tetratricopeptide (TPR) repeat protein
MSFGEKRKVLVYGNCQGGWLAGALSQKPEIAQLFDITYLSDFHGGPPPDHPIHRPEFLATLSIVIWQTASACQPPKFLAALPATCRQIRYPTLWLKMLWPMYAVDPRNQPEQDFPWGRYPYGDRLVMKLLEQNAPVADLAKRYVDTDLNTIVNLDRFSKMSLAELHFNDKQSDIAITPFIEANFRQRKLFGTVNHPTYLVLNQIYHAVEGMLLERPVPANPPMPANATALLGAQETPLHPQIIQHFKLEWAQPDMKWLYHSQFLTLEEYLPAYAAFTAIPLGATPQLWLARTQQTLAQKNFEEGEILLLEGAAQFPAVPEFLQYLGVLRAQQGKLIEAEKVFRYALTRFPKSASIYSELGMVMSRQEMPGEAVLMFKEALKIDPRHAGARHNLPIAQRAANAA